MAIVVSSLCFGLAAASFWRKDFVAADLAHMTIWLMGSCCHSTLLSSCGLVLGLLWKHDRAITGIQKNVLMIAFLLVIHLAWQSMELLCSFAEWSSLAAVAAGFQLLRNPVWLKDRLRQVRIATGPVYWLSSSLSFIHFSNGGGTLSVFFSYLGVVLVSTACLILRPDNDKLEAAITSFVGCRVCVQDARKRAFWHGMCLLTSTLILAVCAMHQQCIHTCILFGALLIMEFRRRRQR